MIFETLYESAQRGELLLIDGGFCHWHLRRDGQLTIREIISTRKGAGGEMLNILKRTPGALSIFAKCPEDIAANLWYEKRGFLCEGLETVSSGRHLKLWRLNLNQSRTSISLPTLIFCGGNNPTFAQIAIGAGYKYGARLPSTVYGPVYFADQDWKNPDRAVYMAALEKQRPFMASVIDFERAEQREEVLSWAEEAAQFVKVVMIIPKVSGEICTLPHQIGGADIRLGYSVPTKYGGTELPLNEFSGWPVHLLGGSPGAQMRLAQYMDVRSVDGNMMMKMANRGLYWISGKRQYSNHWVSILETDGERWDGDGNYEAFRRSCMSVKIAWQKLIHPPEHSIHISKKVVGGQ